MITTSIDPSPWPFIGSLSALFSLSASSPSSVTCQIAGLQIGGLVFGLGVIGVLYTMAAWWVDVNQGSAGGGSYPRGSAASPVWHDHVHRFRGDVLCGLVLAYSRPPLSPPVAASPPRRCHPVRARGAHGRCSGRRKGSKTFNPLAPATLRHADPADVGHHSDLGAPRDDRKRPAVGEVGIVP